MNQAHQLAQRLEEVFLSGKWIANTNYSEILSDLDFEQANQRIGTLNSIGLLTQHINYYVEGMLPVFEGGELSIHDKHSFDFEPFKNEEEWNGAKNRIKLNSIVFINQIKLLDETKLRSVFVKEEYGTFARNIEVMIEHAYYHLGQISFIKKMILNEEK